MMTTPESGAARVCPGVRVILPPVNESNTLPAPRPSLSDRIASRWRNDLVFFVVAIVVIALDQTTKAWVRQTLFLGETWEHSLGPIHVVRVVNSGAAFGILQGATPFLIITSILGLAAIVLYYLYPPMDHGLVRIALGMQLGGAIGNLIDRVRLGEVTDWIDVGGFPTFNVADSSISISIVVVLIFFAMQDFAPKRPPPDQAESAAVDDVADRD
jgi:signal peptidase II